MGGFRQVGQPQGIGLVGQESVVWGHQRRQLGIGRGGGKPRPLLLQVLGQLQASMGGQAIAAFSA